MRTAYKSPTSVHIFSFSVEDDHLFKTLPVLPPNVIRSHTVIQGWSIEALSPTTTQVTLIEQTDLRGWSNKSWTYQQMVTAVSGVGDFTIKFGSPPVATRLLGAKASVAHYNHDKASYKLEYRPLPSVPVVANAPGAADDATTEVARKAEPLNIECELRCDCDVWASSLDIVTDPPPSRVSVLSRHRLATSGGCWITIEHDAATLGHDKMMVLVRKGPSTRAKGSVYVNGAKANVDNEALHEDDVKTLTTQKRIKAAPVPLDQWHGPKSATPTRSASPRPADISTLGIPDSASIPSQVPKDAVDRPPLSYALDALALLQAFHAVQGPELSSPVPGWTTVSEKGGYLRKRFVSSLSTLYPVQRGDKVVEGLAAEQMLAQIVNHKARLKWDTKLEACQLLESFGSGCQTSMQVTKPAFLTFRNRIFHLATITSHIRIPSASATSSTSQVYLCASASCPLTPNFPASSLNPQTYPIGQVLLEGWLLETIDPYTSETFAIPSTRVSHFSCVNWGGAVPQALGSMLNPSPLKVIEAVAAQARSTIPVPRMQIPASTVQIEGPLNADNLDECDWSLNTASKRKEADLVCTSLDSDAATFGFVVLLPRTGETKVHLRSPSAPIPPANRVKVPLLRSPASLANLPKSPRLDQVDEDRPLTPSAGTGPTLSAMASLPASPTKQKAKAIHDQVIAEVILEAAEGFRSCEIKLAALETEGLLATFGLDRPPVNLPFKVSLHEMAQGGMAASASSQQHHYLLRFTLPTAQYLAPVNDPLREGLARPIPDWLKTLQTKSMLVAVDIVAAHDDLGGSGADKINPRRFQAWYKENELPLISERDSRAILEQHADEDWVVHAAQLSRRASYPSVLAFLSDILGIRAASRLCRTELLKVCRAHCDFRSPSPDTSKLKLLVRMVSRTKQLQMALIQHRLRYQAMV